jgi:hypothetical protein
MIRMGQTAARREDFSKIPAAAIRPPRISRRRKGVGPLCGSPSNLTATVVSESQIDLTWTDNATDETDYVILRSPDNATWTEIATLGANATTYSDTTVSSDTEYYYRVVAVNGVGQSAYGVVPEPVQYGAPALRADGPETISEGQTCTITLASAPAPGNAPIASWHIDWGDSQSGTTSASSATHQYTTGTGTYTVFLTAYNTGGGGPFPCPNSVAVGVLPAAPTGLSASGRGRHGQPNRVAVDRQFAA